MTTAHGQPLAQGKPELRRALLQRRASLTPAARDQAATKLAAVVLELPVVRRAGRVALYASRGAEPGTGPLRTALRERGTTVLLPVTAGEKLDWAVDDGQLVPGAFGIGEPGGPRLGEQALHDVDLVLVPALAVDTAGTRLGYGRGFYDRALQHTGPQTLVLALLYDEELLDIARTPIDAEPHDHPVHGVLTPTRWVWLRPGQHN